MLNVGQVLKMRRNTLLNIEYRMKKRVVVEMPPILTLGQYQAV